VCSADPAHYTVDAIAHRRGFTNLSRFAAAHKKMYGQTPLHALRAAH
jgi:AraC-like DNA-binding protein